jgi:DNA-directed RNA polymerase subunit RPC12/RpoP
MDKERYKCEHCGKYFFGYEAKRGVLRGSRGAINDTSMICPHCNEPTQGIIDNELCACGNVAVGNMIVPIGNVYAGLREATQKIPVCEYHKNKAKQQGHEIRPLF